MLKLAYNATFLYFASRKLNSLQRRDANNPDWLRPKVIRPGMADQVRKYKLDPIPRKDLLGVVNQNVCDFGIRVCKMANNS